MNSAPAIWSPVIVGRMDLKRAYFGNDSRHAKTIRCRNLIKLNWSIWESSLPSRRYGRTEVDDLCWFQKWCKYSDWLGAAQCSETDGVKLIMHICMSESKASVIDGPSVVKIYIWGPQSIFIHCSISGNLNLIYFSLYCHRIWLPDFNVKSWISHWKKD